MECSVVVHTEGWIGVYQVEMCGVGVTSDRRSKVEVEYQESVRFSYTAEKRGRRCRRLCNARSSLYANFVIPFLRCSLGIFADISIVDVTFRFLRFIFANRFHLMIDKFSSFVLRLRVYIFWIYGFLRSRCVV